MEICFRCSRVVDPENFLYGLHKDCFLSWFSLNSPAEFQDVVLARQEDDSSFDGSPINASFLQGKFKKYSAKLDNHSYILKIQEEDYPELPVVEYLCNQIAQAIGMIIPSFYLIRFPNEIDAKLTFVVDNFMEKHTPGNLIHIYHFIGEQPFAIHTILNIIKEKVGRLEAMKQFAFLCLFDALIGNHDRHGRNMGLIETKKGFELAPFYDNTSYLGIEDQSLLLAHHNPRGKISASDNAEPTMQHYVIAFCQMGFKNWVDEFLRKIDQINILELVRTSFLSEKRKKGFSNLIERRLQEAKDAYCS
jgi:6-pyruvoyl-tetrahydropterin synthase